MCIFSSQLVVLVTAFKKYFVSYLLQAEMAKRRIAWEEDQLVKKDERMELEARQEAEREALRVRHDEEARIEEEARRVEVGCTLSLC